MAKNGSAKNTRNKAKHSKLMNQKKNKLRQVKLDRELRLKNLRLKIKEQNGNL